VHGDPADVVAADLALSGVQPGANLDAERLHRVANRHRAADRSLGDRLGRGIDPRHGVVASSQVRGQLFESHDLPREIAGIEREWLND